MQQINLYLPELRPRIDWLRLEIGLAVSLFLIFAFFALYVFRTQQYGQLKEEIETLKNNLDVVTEQADSLKQKPDPEGKKALEKKITEARNALKARKKLVHLVGGESLGNREGFYQFIEATSAQRVKGVSLVDFEYIDGGNFAAYSGVALKPELVPYFISQLQHEVVFENVKFGVLTMEKDTQGVKFNLSGKYVEPTGDSVAKKSNAVLRRFE